MTIIKIEKTIIQLGVPRKVSKVYQVAPFGIPNGIVESSFQNQGGILVGTGPGTFVELAPGLEGQVLLIDPAQPEFMRWGYAAVPQNELINGGFWIAQRQAAGTLTTIADNGYGPDRWRLTRENADLQYVRVSGVGEAGLHSKYYGQFKKITNAGKFMACQILSGAASMAYLGEDTQFQMQMKASVNMVIRMAIMELKAAGTMDTLPAALVAAWGADAVDPTFGANLAVVGAGLSQDVSTVWQNFNVKATVPTDSKNLVCAIWTDSDVAANATLSLAEGGFYPGSNLQPWRPRPLSHEKILMLRHYWKSFPEDTAPAQSAGVLGVIRMLAGKAGANANLYSIRFPVPMFGVPALTFYNPSAGNAQARDSSAAVDCSATGNSAGLTSQDMFGYTTTGAAGTAVGNALDVHVTAEKEL